MSERFLKYETEAENGMVDERGVLIPGAASGGKMTIVDIGTYMNNHEQKVYDNELYNMLSNLIRTGTPICFYWSSEYGSQYSYPTQAYFSTSFDTGVNKNVETIYFSLVERLSVGEIYFEVNKYV